MFNRNQLKIMMMLLMVLDHIPMFVSPNTSAVFHVLTRCVGVFFAYMVVEGMRYTRNQVGYLQRLWSAAGLMIVGNLLINQIVLEKYAVHNNIFLTLAVGGTLVYCVSRVRQSDTMGQRVLAIAVIGICLASSLVIEGGTVILPFMLICTVFSQRQTLRNLLLCAFSVVLFLMSFVDYGNWHETLQMLAYNSDFLFITILPILALYNGEKGSSQPVMKYVFYIFYPAHLYIIALMATYILG